MATKILNGHQETGIFGYMAAINVLRKVKLSGTWKTLPVAKGVNKLDWTHVTYRGVPLVATEGTFYLEYRAAGRKIRRAVGDHPREAKIALEDQKSILGLRERGIVVTDAKAILDNRPITGPKIADTVAGFVSNPPLGFRVRSISKYSNALLGFGKWTTKTHLSQLTREDVIGFMSYLVSVEGVEISTAVDKGHIVHSIMNNAGAEIRMKRGDWPKFTEQEREVYRPEILQQLFKACNEEEFTLFQTFLMTGFRDQEVGFLSWEDFNATKSTLRVSKKKDMGFDPKNYQERTIPIPTELVTLLKEHRKRLPEDAYLIFPTSSFLAHQGRPGGQRDKHMLERLKKIALRAGLNCGRCETKINGKPVSCRDKPVCNQFGLHRFRHTYATSMLHDGVDIISLQFLLGHKDLDSTRKYLKALRVDDLLAKIKASSIMTRFNL